MRGMVHDRVGEEFLLEGLGKDLPRRLLNQRVYQFVLNVDLALATTAANVGSRRHKPREQRYAVHATRINSATDA